MSAVAEHAQTADNLFGSANRGAVLRMAQDANQPVFREGAGRPSAGALIAKPIVRQLVMDMVGIEQRDKHVDVEQRNRYSRGSGVVSQLVDQPQRRPRRSRRTTRQHRHTVPHTGRAGRRQSFSSQLRQHFPGRRSPRRRDFLGGLQDVFVEIEGRAHTCSITHHASDVNATTVQLTQTDA